MIKGILFDKDGTLIDFSLWRNAGIKIINILMDEYNITDNEIFNQLQKSIGITETGIDPFGALAYSSHENLASELHFVLSKYRNIDLGKFQIHVPELLRKEVLRDDIEFIQMTNIRELYKHLNSNDIKMGLATADTYQSAMHMINKLNLNDCFDFVGAYDGVMKRKPHKDMCERFCNKYNLKPSEVAIVGDSYGDMLFARNSGAIGVGVLSGVSNKINLKDIANVIIPTIDYLFHNEVLMSLDEEGFTVRELYTA